MKLFQTLFIVGILTSLVFTASSAYALTADEIQALILQLENQIAQLKKQLVETEPAPWCHTFDTNLRIGDVSDEVVALHIALQKQGFLDEEVSGKEFDEKIASAIVGFQERYRSEVLRPFGLARGTGFVGKTTRAKLNALYACSGETVSTPPTSDTTPVIDSIQGPVYLTVGQKGTWTVQARNLEQGTFTYSVDWGNGETVSGVLYSVFIRQNGYSTPGIYTIRFTITDNQNVVAKKSVTVNVVSQQTKNNAPRILTKPSIPAAVPVNTYLPLNFTATDADGDELAWAADWGGGVADSCPVASSYN